MVYGKSLLCSKTYYHVYIFSLMKKSESKNGISRGVQETRSPDLWVALGLILLMEKLKYPGKLAEAF